MEFLPGGSLASYLPRHKSAISQLLIFAQQICQVSFDGIYELNMFCEPDNIEYVCKLIITLNMLDAFSIFEKGV